MPGPYRHFKESLAVSLPALASMPGVSVAVVTGRDDAFAEELRTRSAGFGTTNVHVLGYVEHMAPLMAASDVALAKPGGLVCAECINMALPLVLVGPAAGQERANATALANAGAAVFAEDPRMLAEFTRKAAAHPKRLARMRAAAESLSRPLAAADIATRVLALAGVEIDRGRSRVSEPVSSTLALGAAAFAIALTGAMAPGPYLTVTITRTIRHGRLNALLMLAGHAALEAALIAAFAFGLQRFLEQPTVINTLSLLGGAFLLWMGGTLLYGAVEGHGGRRSRGG